MAVSFHTNPHTMSSNEYPFNGINKKKINFNFANTVNIHLKREKEMERKGKRNSENIL